MRAYKFPAAVLSALVLSLIANSFVFAQGTVLPLGLTERSTLAEILNWLDQTAFPQARIGLEANFDGPKADEVITTSTRYYEEAFFSKGFRLVKIDGCRLTLRNDNTELLRFGTKYPDPAEGSLHEFRKTQNSRAQFKGEFTIPLQTIKADKAPFQHTRKAEQAALLGTWRAAFGRRWKSGFFLIPSKDKLRSLLENQVKMEIVDPGTDSVNDSMTGDKITFTFDDKQVSENFYAVLGRAIALCKE